ncbi:MAG: prohibitin family protein [Zoogloeaceae bacterium]|jgi:regulator of protease activity HflC (stomatin/prohibitin superfamily)|nr:prohibitin family protein [Zoogloeaceae bacterium]
MEDFNTPDADAPRSRKEKIARALHPEKLADLLKNALCASAATLHPFRRGLMVCGILGVIVGVFATHLPFQSVGRGEMGLRINQWTGGVSRFQEGSVLVIPGIHEMRAFSLRDQVYHPEKKEGDRRDLSFQSVEGLSLGIDFTVRYALDPDKIPTMARLLPEDISGEVVLPVIQDVLHKTLSRYTVREIFSARRQEIQAQVSKELQTRLAGDGVKLKLLTIGKIDLPDDYMAGMEKLLEAELATEQMRHTLELKEKKVKESELVALADKVRREKAAEAAGEEQIIAAKAQAEAMKHILPFKEKQIQQRALEAEADKVTRLKNAQANADARRIEAEAEADSRKKLAEAEVFRMEQIGKVNSEQMARDGALLAKNPLLIQKSLADKLSDKISVIIAPPGTNGAFIGENLIGRLPAPEAPAHTGRNRDNSESDEEE